MLDVRVMQIVNVPVAVFRSFFKPAYFVTGMLVTRKIDADRLFSRLSD